MSNNLKARICAFLSLSLSLSLVASPPQATTPPPPFLPNPRFFFWKKIQFSLYPPTELIWAHFVSYVEFSPPPPRWSIGMRSCRSNWPALCLFYCYQLSCVVIQQSWFGLILFHNFTSRHPAVDDIGDEWLGKDYDITQRNSAHFCDFISETIGGDRIPRLWGGGEASLRFGKMPVLSVVLRIYREIQTFFSNRSEALLCVRAPCNLVEKLILSWELYFRHFNFKLWQLLSSKNKLRGVIVFIWKVKALDIIQNSPDTSKLPDSLGFPYIIIINPISLFVFENNFNLSQRMKHQFHLLPGQNQIKYLSSLFMAQILSKTHKTVVKGHIQGINGHCKQCYFEHFSLKIHHYGDLSKKFFKKH